MKLCGVITENIVFTPTFTWWRHSYRLLTHACRTLNERLLSQPSEWELIFLTSYKGGGTCFCECMFVCVSVCLLARLLKNACMDFDEMLRVDRCRDMDELINF